MTNHEIIEKALGIMRKPLSKYILEQLQMIPEYKIDDRWWQDGVLGALRDQRDVIKLSPYKAYDERQDAMDMTVCLGLMIAHWPNLFRYKLPPSARSWISEIQSARNDWARFDGKDFTDQEAARALDTMSLLMSRIAVSYTHLTLPTKA